MLYFVYVCSNIHFVDVNEAEQICVIYTTIFYRIISLTALQSDLNRCTVQPFTESDDTRCFVNTIFPPEDGHVNARNMSRMIV